MKASKELAKELAYFARECGSFPHWENPAYSQHRKKLWDKQIDHNISSIYWAEVYFIEKLIRFPTYATELLFMPQDKAILERHKMTTVEKFLQFQAIHNFEMTYENEPVNQDFVRHLAKKYDHATLSASENRHDFILSHFDSKPEIERLKGSFTSVYSLDFESLPPIPIKKREREDDHGASGVDSVIIFRTFHAYLPEV